MITLPCSPQPEKTPEMAAKIRAALDLKDLGFRINPHRAQNGPQAIKEYGIATDIEQLRFDLVCYDGGEPKYGLTLSVPSSARRVLVEWPKLNITRDEAQKLLAAIEQAPHSAVLGLSRGHSPSNFNRLTMVLRGYYKGVDRYATLLPTAQEPHEDPSHHPRQSVRKTGRGYGRAARRMPK